MALDNNLIKRIFKCFKPKYLQFFLAFFFIFAAPAIAHDEDSTVSQPVQLTAHEKAWLADHPNLRVAPDPDFPPVEWIDEKGVFQGMAADFVALLERQLAVKFEIVQLPNWDEVISSAKNRRIDILSAVSPSPQREEYLLFTKPHIVLPGLIFVRDDVKGSMETSDLRGKKVTVVSQYVWQDYLTNDYPEITLFPAPSVAAGLQMVSFGSVDAMVGDPATAIYYLQKEGISNLRVAGETEYKTYLSFGSRKDWPELNTILEKALDNIDPEDVNAIFDKWLNLNAESIFDKKAFWIFSATALGIIIFSLVGVIVWNKSLRRLVDKKAHELNNELAEKLIAMEALKENEKKLQETNELFSKIFYNSPMGIAITNMSNGEFVEMNDKFSSITGYDRTKTMALTTTEVGLWPSKEKRKQLINNLKKRGAIKNEEVEFRNASGELRLGQASVELIKYKGEACMISVLRDITGQKRADEEKQQLEERLRELRKMEAIGTLAGGVAHQFNNALSVVEGNIELMEAEFQDDKEIAHYANQIKTSARRMAQLTAQLLIYARGGKYQVRKISLSDFIADTLPMIGCISEPGIHVDTYFADDIFDIKADPTQMEMVLSEILLNAFEAMGGEGRISIDCSNEVITEQIAREFPGFRPDTYVLMTITDDGKGMDEETKNRVFEPFFTTKFTGRGLGMATAYGFVKSHDGYIMVDSEPGKGTTVKIYLPACEVAGE